MNTSVDMGEEGRGAGEPTAWAWEYDCGKGDWETTISDFRPSDTSWRRNIRPLYEHPPSPAAAIPSGGHLSKIPAHLRSKVAEVLSWSDEDWLLLKAYFPEEIERFRKVLAPASCDEQPKAEDAIAAESRSDASAVGKAETPQVPVSSPPNPPPTMTAEEALRPFAKLADEIELLAKQTGEPVESWAKTCSWEDLVSARAALRLLSDQDTSEGRDA